MHSNPILVAGVHKNGAHSLHMSLISPKVVGTLNCFLILLFYVTSDFRLNSILARIIIPLKDLMAVLLIGSQGVLEVKQVAAVFNCMSKAHS